MSDRNNKNKLFNGLYKWINKNKQQSVKDLKIMKSAI